MGGQVLHAACRGKRGRGACCSFVGLYRYCVTRAVVLRCVNAPCPVLQVENSRLTELVALLQRRLEGS